MQRKAAGVLTHLNSVRCPSRTKAFLARADASISGSSCRGEGGGEGGAGGRKGGWRGRVRGGGGEGGGMEGVLGGEAFLARADGSISGRALLLSTYPEHNL